MMSKPQINVTLVNEEKWLEFAPDTEMILTKPGRLLYPFLDYKIRGLSPTEMYCFEVQMERVGDKKYKFNGGKWNSDGDADVRRVNKVVKHPSGYTLGADVMNSTISFQKLRITNCETNKNMPLTILLEAQHRYMPILIIKKFDNRINEAVIVSKISFTFTAFYAVTAYQNDQQIELKKEHNKYAAGFRKKEGIENKPAKGRKRANVDGNSKGGPQNKKACNQMPVQHLSSLPNPVPNQFDFMSGMPNENIPPFAQQPNFQHFSPNLNYNEQFVPFQENKNIHNSQYSYNHNYSFNSNMTYPTYNPCYDFQPTYNHFPNNFTNNFMDQPAPIQPVEGQVSLNISPASSYTLLN